MPVRIETLADDVVAHLVLLNVVEEPLGCSPITPAVDVEQDTDMILWRSCVVHTANARFYQSRELLPLRGFVIRKAWLHLAHIVGEDLYLRWWDFQLPVGPDHSGRDFIADLDDVRESSVGLERGNHLGCVFLDFLFQRVG